MTKLLDGEWNFHNSLLILSKISSWSELSQFFFDIVLLASENAAPDMFTLIASMQPGLPLKEIHKQLCHPGITRLHHLSNQRICFFYCTGQTNHRKLWILFISHT